MTAKITQKEVIAATAASDVGMLWMIRQEAEKLGKRGVARDCFLAIGNEYRRQGASKQYRHALYRLDRRAFDRSIELSTKSLRERRWLRSQYFLGIADGLKKRRKLISAGRFYMASLQFGLMQPKVCAKLLLVSITAGRPSGRGVLNRLRGAGPVAKLDRLKIDATDARAVGTEES
jgi:hypothetical protein